jgi:hypothetical protein
LASIIYHEPSLHRDGFILPINHLVKYVIIYHTHKTQGWQEPSEVFFNGAYLDRGKNMSLTVFKTDNGIELVIDTSTGEAFATQAGYARMSGVSKQAVSKRFLSVNQEGLKTAEIVTASGLQGVNLIPAKLVYRWSLKDNLELAEKMGEAGATVYMHQLAGYSVTSTVVEPARPQTMLEWAEAFVISERARIAAEEKAILLEAENSDLVKDVDRLSEVVDELFDYSSIIRIAKYNGCSERDFNWRKLKAASDVKKIEIKKAPCQRYVTKNLYHHDVWRYAYPDVRLPETTTLVITA